MGIYYIDYDGEENGSVAQKALNELSVGSKRIEKETTV